MEILLVLVTGILCIVCFFSGIQVGQKIDKNETIKPPNLNPANVIREYKEEKEAELEQRKNKVISDNIDNYDGTGFGQKDIPIA